MITMKDIIREGHETLNVVAQKVNIPICDEDKTTLLEMLGYVINSQNEDLAKKHKLRAAVGLAAPQINISKRMFAVMVDGLDGINVIACVNPEIIEKSKEMVYLPDGEGCLSVDRATSGITPRHKTIVFKGQIYDFKTNKFRPVKMKLTGYMSIVFQHEYDHLDGILFTNKLYNENDEIIKNAKPFSFED